MIQISPAWSCIRQYTRGIWLEIGSWGINCHWDWSSHNSCLHGEGTIWERKLEPICWDFTQVFVKTTSSDFLSGSRNIGIITCQLNLVIIWVKIGKRGKPTITTVVAILSISTVNQLLFWKTEHVTLVDEITWFKGGNSSESPTWATMPLVFDWGNCTLFYPVDVILQLTEELLGLLRLWRKLAGIRRGFGGLGFWVTVP